MKVDKDIFFLGKKKKAHKHSVNKKKEVSKKKNLENKKENNSHLVIEQKEEGEDQNGEKIVGEVDGLL